MTPNQTVLLCTPEGRFVPDLCTAMTARNPGKSFVQCDASDASDVLAKLLEDGVTDVICVPLTLFSDGLVKDVLPGALETFGQQHSHVSLRLAREAGLDPLMLQAARDRVAPLLTDPPHQTVLVVVGDGAGDEDADADVSKLARMVWEGLGAAWTEVCFLDNAQPRLEDALPKALAYGYPRVVIFPYTLNDRLEFSDVVTSAASGVEILVAKPLGAHDLVIEVLSERIRQAIDGDGHLAMNCQVCSFREQVLGGAHGHSHDHAHDHDHSHPHDHS